MWICSVHDGGTRHLRVFLRSMRSDLCSPILCAASKSSFFSLLRLDHLGAHLYAIKKTFWPWLRPQDPSVTRPYYCRFWSLSVNREHTCTYVSHTRVLTHTDVKCTFMCVSWSLTLQTIWRQEYVVVDSRRDIFGHNDARGNEARWTRASFDHWRPRKDEKLNHVYSKSFPCTTHKTVILHTGAIFLLSKSPGFLTEAEVNYLYFPRLSLRTRLHWRSSCPPRCASQAQECLKQKTPLLPPRLRHQPRHTLRIYVRTQQFQISCTLSFPWPAFVTFLAQRSKRSFR